MRFVALFRQDADLMGQLLHTHTHKHNHVSMTSGESLLDVKLTFPVDLPYPYPLLASCLPHNFNSYIMRTCLLSPRRSGLPTMWLLSQIYVLTARVGRAQKLSLTLTSSEIWRRWILNVEFHILHLFLTVPLLLQLLVLNAYQGQLALMERRHFPHLL